MDVEGFLATLRGTPDGEGLVHERRLPSRRARFADLTRPLLPGLQAALAQQGVDRLYAHQAAAVEAVRGGRHVVIVTGTASGKTLCYNLPVLEAILSDPRARALYLFPIQALAQDQAGALADFGLPDLCWGTYDGDTPQPQRRRLRETAHILLTNPDMLHLGILPQHFRWRSFFSQLRAVVVDDAHIYRGVFGSHVALILRRLRRVCAVHGSSPVFICTSATVANPQEFGERLLGLPVSVMDDDGSPRPPKRFALWNPPLLDVARTRRRSTYTEATRLFTRLVRHGARTIAFAKARKITELLYRYAAFALREEAPALADRISAYRAGYLPEERRRIERRLFTGDLAGVVTTSALELGIDVGGLDAAVLVGYPGTIASTWQRAGRVGRGKDEALIILIALEDALDQFLMRHPEYLFERPCEHAVVDPENPYILAGHLRCAASELPLWEGDRNLFGPRAMEIAALLAEVGDLGRRRERWYWQGAGYPAQAVDVRSSGGGTYRIVDASTGRLVGTVEEARAFEQVHPGAVYLHHGDPYVVHSLDRREKVARVKPADGDHYTQPRVLTDLTILREQQRRPWGPTTAHFGDVEVSEHVIAFARKQLFTEEVLGVESLDLPPQVLQTKALWFPIPQALEDRLRAQELDLAGSIHAVEHAAIGLLPLFSMCDRWDIGGVSYPAHPQTGLATIFVYDGHPGGVGITEKGYALLEDLLRASLRAIEECPCEAGCPSCVQSPKCGNMNDPLDKRGATVLLRLLLGAQTPAPRARRSPRSSGAAARPRR
ncbi:MAG: DUF1998 domain-containing protein [Armatimonadetes bacterium]|nr:DUF1998 domain-containing protein [Armatimonadota bacterium]